MKVFTVERVGVYGHGCGGVFTTHDLAIEAIKEFLKLEPDDYHVYHVESHELDKKSGFDSEGHGHMEGGELVAYVSYLSTGLATDSRKRPYEITVVGIKDAPQTV